MKRTLFFLITIVICISTSAQSTELSAKQKEKFYPSGKIVSRYHNDWTQTYFPKRISLFMNDPLEFGDIVFLGNSLTEGGGDWSAKFGVDHVRNRGIAGDVTDGVLRRLDEIVYFKARAVFLLIGINDLSSIHHEDEGDRFKYIKVVPSTEYIGNNILKIAKAIHRKSPETKIYVQTLLPSRREYMKEDILEVNEWIRSYESKGYYEVIDLFAQFVDENGDMQEDLTTDGIHLTEKGYELWVKIEKPVVEGLVAQE